MNNCCKKRMRDLELKYGDVIYFECPRCVKTLRYDSKECEWVAI